MLNNPNSAPSKYCICCLDNNIIHHGGSSLCGIFVMLSMTMYRCSELYALNDNIEIKCRCPSHCWCWALMVKTCMCTVQRHASMQTVRAIPLSRELQWKQSFLAGDYFYVFTATRSFGTNQEEARQLW